MKTPIPVLLYHSVSDRPAPGDSWGAVSWADFTSHVNAVKASGREPIGITALAAALRAERPLPDRPVAITFDDGSADTYAAVEELLRHDLVSTVYVTSGEVGERARLSPGQLLSLARLPGIEVGAHAVRHRRLDELDDAELARQLRVSKAHLEDLTQRSVRSFAYPHGSYDSRVREAVIAAGYDSAAAVKNAISHPRDDPYAIARWTVTEGTPAARISQILEGRGVPVAWAHERLRTRAYRTARRQRRRLLKSIGARC
jgi:peptidoglycan/xylan/chitin deacetylase (PgdA/CDA1 family)